MSVISHLGVIFYHMSSEIMSHDDLQFLLGLKTTVKFCRFRFQFFLSVLAGYYITMCAL